MLLNISGELLLEGIVDWIQMKKASLRGFFRYLAKY